MLSWMQHDALTSDVHSPLLKSRLLVLFLQSRLLYQLYLQVSQLVGKDPLPYSAGVAVAMAYAISEAMYVQFQTNK
jgi:hypothetical protein